MRHILCLLMAASLLAGCSGGGKNQQYSSLQTVASAGTVIADDARSLIYAYPALGQVEVPPAAPIVLRFSHPIQSDAAADMSHYITIAPSAGGMPVQFTTTATPDGYGVVLQPKSTTPLTEGTQYTISGAAVPLVMSTGDVATVNVQRDGTPELTFTTRPATEGPLQKMSPTFQVAAMLPDPNSFLIGVPNYQPIDFSSLRLQLTQPIDPITAVYGTTISLTDGNSNLVPAHLLVKFHDMTIDPVADLDPSQQYTLTIKSGASGLKSTFNTTLASDYTYSFQPQASGASLSGIKAVVNVPAGGSLSMLTGGTVNQVPVASPLLGQGAGQTAPNIAQASGTMYADISQAGQYLNVLPMRVPRGNILSASAISVHLAGNSNADSGLKTGQLTITLLSDANGILTPNHYSAAPNAPSLVNLQLEMGLSAADPTSNGAFTQRLMHVQLAGLASLDLDAHTLNIDAVGTVDLKVLGVDNAVGVLAFKMQIDTTGKPAYFTPDTTAPTIQSWVPGDGASVAAYTGLDAYSGLNGGEYVRPGDSLIVNFSKAMDEDSLKNPGAVTLKIVSGTNAGTSVPVNLRVDGSALVVQPQQPLAFGTQYVLTVNNQGSNQAPVTDIAGNALGSSGISFLSPGSSFAFEVPAQHTDAVTAATRPPIVLSLAPGYPCAMDTTNRNLGGETPTVGQCAGGKSSDDKIPLPNIQQRQTISVVFSQDVSTASLALGASCGASASFRVEQIDTSGSCQSVVKGSLFSSSGLLVGSNSTGSWVVSAAAPITVRAVQFVPDSPWTAGLYYHYVLGSNGDLTSSTATCDGTQSICGANKLPLQTQLIAQETATGGPGVTNPQHGGPNMDLWMLAVVDDPTISTVGLRVLPIEDVNANFRLDAGERLPFQYPDSTNGTPIDMSKVDATKVCTTGTDTGGQIGNDMGTATPGRCVASNGALLQPDNVSNGPAFSGAATSFEIGCKAAKDSEAEGPSKGQECQGNQFLLISSNLGASLAGYGNVTNPISGAAMSGIVVKVAPTVLLTSGSMVYATLGIATTASPITAGLISALSGIPGLGSLVTTLQGALDSGATVLNNTLLNSAIAIKDQANSDVPSGAAFTGPLVFRMRFPANMSYIPGVIQSTTDSNGKAQLKLTTWLNLYTDIPELNAAAVVAGAVPIPISHSVFSNTNLSGDGCDAQQGDTAPHCNGSGTTEASGIVNFLPDGRMTAQLSNTKPVLLTIPLSGLAGQLAGTLKVIVPAGRFIVDASLAPLKQ